LAYIVGAVLGAFYWISADFSFSKAASGQSEISIVEAQFEEMCVKERTTVLENLPLAQLMVLQDEAIYSRWCDCWAINVATGLSIEAKNGDYVPIETQTTITREAAGHCFEMVQ